MAMEFLSVGGYFRLEMLRRSGKGWRCHDSLNNGYVPQTSHERGYALDSLLNAAPQLDERSGRYRLISAVPI